jgi:hypothetical protein
MSEEFRIALEDHSVCPYHLAGDQRSFRQAAPEATGRPRAEFCVVHRSHVVNLGFISALGAARRFRTPATRSRSAQLRLLKMFI